MLIPVVLFIIFIILGSSVTTFPLVLLLLLNMAVASRKTSILIAGFFCGLIFDILVMNPLGQTSIFYIIFLSLIFLYERKYDIQTFPFVLISSFLGSFTFLYIQGSNFIFLESIVSAFVGLLIFFIIIKADRLHLGKGKLQYAR